MTKKKSPTLTIILIAGLIIAVLAVIGWIVLAGQGKNYEKRSLLRESFKPGEFKRPAGEFRPNVILITIDNLRPDALGIYGNWDAKTPAIDSLLQNGAVFDSFFQTTPLVAPNVASLFTGLYPPEHGVRDDLHFKLSGPFKTLAEHLKEAGYSTEAFIAGIQFRSRLGANQGFDKYDDSLLAENNIQPELYAGSLPAEQLNKKVIASLKTQAQSGKPFFMWIQYADLKPPFKKQGVRAETDDVYGKAVANLDAQVGKLLEYVRAQSWYQNSLIILTATKPQNLGEHKEKVPGAYLYDVDLRTPFVVSSPSIFTGRSVVKNLTASIDLLPSLLELLSLKESSGLSGKSFVGSLSSAGKKGNLSAEAERMIYLETFTPTAAYGIYPIRGLRGPQYKLILEGSEKRFFDLAENPLEISHDDAKYKELIEQYSDTLKKIESNFRLEPTTKAYVGSSFSTSGYGELFEKMTGVVLDDSFLAPLKSGQEKAATLKEQLIVGQTEKGKQQTYNDYLKRIRENLSTNPYSLTNRLALAELYSINSVYANEAISEAYFALKQDPLNLPTYQFIARLFAQAGLKDKMAEFWQLAREANPSWASPILNLTMIALSEAKDSEVSGIVSPFAKTNPSEASAVWVTLAGAKIDKKDWPRALEYLNASLELIPGNLAARGARAQVFLELGQTQEALKDLEFVKVNNSDLMDQVFYRSIIYYATEWKNMNLAKDLLKEFKRMAANPYFPTIADAYIEEVRNEPYIAIEKLDLIVKNESDKDKKAWLYQKIAGLYYGRKNSEKAKEYYQKALEINPYLPESANNYAWIVGIEDKKIQEGMKWIYRALSKVPDNPHLLDTLAELHHLNGRTDLAIKIEQDAIKIDPKNKSFQDNLARYQKATKKAA